MPNEKVVQGKLKLPLTIGNSNPWERTNSGDELAFQVLDAYPRDGKWVAQNIGSGGGFRPQILVAAGEKWEMSYRVSAANADDQSFGLTMIFNENSISVIMTS